MALILGGPAGAGGRVKLIDDKFSQTVTLTGPEIRKIPLVGTSRSWALATMINKKTGFYSNELVAVIGYDSSWRRYSRAADDNATPLNVIRTGKTILGCDSTSCLLNETICIDIPETQLFAHAGRDYEIKVVADSGDSAVLTLTAEQITAQLAALADYKSTRPIIAAESGISAPSKLRFGATFVMLPASLAGIMQRPGMQVWW